MLLLFQVPYILLYSSEHEAKDKWNIFIEFQSIKRPACILFVSISKLNFKFVSFFSSLSIIVFFAVSYISFKAFSYFSIAVLKLSYCSLHLILLWPIGYNIRNSSSAAIFTCNSPMENYQITRKLHYTHGLICPSVQVIPDSLLCLWTHVFVFVATADASVECRGLASFDILRISSLTAGRINWDQLATERRISCSRITTRGNNSSSSSNRNLLRTNYRISSTL